ncbi:hypothetical protein [Bradyrhizobium sp. LMG 9283]|uniref:hypothetical protein n=1 Tax=Bradyrhizobium sp. LMG 9283 TaxID=592064 RepID=UPI0038904B67
MVAISGGQFALQAGTLGLPYAVTAVYPFGNEQITIDRNTMKVIATQFTFSDVIKRAAKSEDPIGRLAFHSDIYRDISGIIWLRSSIGNVSTIRHDLVYVQRGARPLPRRRARWSEEYYPLADALLRDRRG